MVSLSMNGSPLSNSPQNLTPAFLGLTLPPDARSGDHLSIILKPAIGPNHCRAYLQVMNAKDSRLD